MTRTQKDKLVVHVRGRLQFLFDHDLEDSYFYMYDDFRLFRNWIIDEKEPYSDDLVKLADKIESKFRKVEEEL